MNTEKKISPAKKRIIENYEQQKTRYVEAGYEEKMEVISIVKANEMAFVTAGPFALVGLIVWLLMKRGGGIHHMGSDMFVFLLLFLVSIFVHECLHGMAWLPWTKGKWKSIYLGVMWEYLTPYCHCKEPLKPKQYLVGVLAPFVVLGGGFYILAFVTGSYLFLVLSLVNILAAGGDTTIAYMEFKYLKYNKNCYILDHPTDCGFVAFMKSE